jgi:hypothetical protein
MRIILFIILFFTACGGSSFSTDPNNTSTDQTGGSTNNITEGTQITTGGQSSIPSSDNTTGGTQITTTDTSTGGSTTNPQATGGTQTTLPLATGGTQSTSSVPISMTWRLGTTYKDDSVLDVMIPDGAPSISTSTISLMLCGSSNNQTANNINFKTAQLICPLVTVGDCQNATIYNFTDTLTPMTVRFTDQGCYAIDLSMVYHSLVSGGKIEFVYNFVNDPGITGITGMKWTVYINGLPDASCNLNNQILASCN